MTSLGAAFVADQGTVVHAENLTRSRAEGCFVALCGKSFVQAGLAKGTRVTCHQCRRLADPLHKGRLPFDHSK